jgi:hypothetical protein
MTEIIDISKAPRVDFSTPPTGAALLTAPNSVTAAAPPAGMAVTTPPNGSFKEVKVGVSGGGLLYWPENNSLIAFFDYEIRELYAQADEHSKKIFALQAANRKVTQASIDLREAHKKGVKAEMEKAEAALQQAISDM